LSEKFSWEGIQLLWIILGLLGAALGIGAMPQMTRKQLWTALGAGAVCAMLAPGAIPELLGWWRNTPAVALPGAVGNLVAFVFGIGGIYFVAGIVAVFKKFQVNPLWVIDFARGRQTLPPPPDPEAPQQDTKGG
jgi:hypothetical protein